MHSSCIWPKGICLKDNCTLNKYSRCPPTSLIIAPVTSHPKEHTLHMQDFFHITRKAVEKNFYMFNKEQVTNAVLTLFGNSSTHSLKMNIWSLVLPIGNDKRRKIDMVNNFTGSTVSFIMLTNNKRKLTSKQNNSKLSVILKIQITMPV